MGSSGWRGRCGGRDTTGLVARRTGCSFGRGGQPGYWMTARNHTNYDTRGVEDTQHRKGIQEMKRELLAAILPILIFIPLASAGDWRGNEQLLMSHPTIQRMHAIHTEHRSRNGLRPQILNAELCRAAQEWSEYMARHGYFEHSHYPLRENIAVGQESAKSTMNGWVHSRGHNANLLGGDQQVGFGAAESADGTRYWSSCHGSGFKVHKGG